MRITIDPAEPQTQPATMNIYLAEQERIRVLNGEDVFAIMQKVLLSENKIDRDKEHFQIVGIDADSRILFIELVVFGASPPLLSSPWKRSG